MNFKPTLSKLILLAFSPCFFNFAIGAEPNFESVYQVVNQVIESANLPFDKQRFVAKMNNQVLILESRAKETFALQFYQASDPSNGEVGLRVQVYSKNSGGYWTPSKLQTSEVKISPANNELGSVYDPINRQLKLSFSKSQNSNWVDQIDFKLKLDLDYNFRLKPQRVSLSAISNYIADQFVATKSEVIVNARWTTAQDIEATKAPAFRKGLSPNDLIGATIEFKDGKVTFATATDSSGKKSIIPKFELKQSDGSYKAAPYTFAKHVEAISGKTDISPLMQREGVSYIYGDILELRFYIELDTWITTFRTYVIDLKKETQEVQKYEISYDSNIRMTSAMGSSSAEIRLSLPQNTGGTCAKSFHGKY